VVLSKTQRGTPTVIHRHYQISRIRAFYTRKVKFTQQNYHDKLSAIIEQFPKFDDVHPFYADLMNVLYDKDHYKLALGQINTARHLVANVAKDYVRLLKYGDSMYRCKQLKRAALGRMCTIMKRQGSSLAYLEQVRQHLSRLPAIDPNTRTLLITGFPNVGKSSFVNKITRADVDVQPYAFTTKSLFVGHTDHNYQRWQVIDTPGILDHPLEERNTIEMQAITAMAHLRAAILYFMDLSEQCGQTIEEQFHLFDSIRPLFANKPLVVVVNKCDIVQIEDTDKAVIKAFDDLAAEGVKVMEMSTLTEIGVIDVRDAACKMLLDYRIEAKMAKGKAAGVLHRLHVATPVPRDDKVREPFIPEAARARRKVKHPVKIKGRGIVTEDMLPDDGPKVRTLRDVEIELREEYSTDMRAEWDLKDSSHRYDDIPEIMDGKNVADFVDPDIMEKLEELEKEEEAREAAGEYEPEPEEDEETQHIRQQAAAIRSKKASLRVESREKKSRNHPVMPAKLKSAIAARERAARDAAAAAPAVAAAGDADAMEEEGGRGRGRERKRKRGSDRDLSRGNSASVDPHNRGLRPSREVAGLAETQIAKARKLKHRSQTKMNAEGRAGEADRMFRNKMPKHLFTGKTKGAKTRDRR